MIQAVIFDWGGVIQRTADPTPRQQLDQALGLPPGSVECAVFESEVFQRASLGLCPADEAWACIVTGLGFTAAQVGDFVERFFAGDRVDETLVRLIRHLRAQGLRVGLLSNAPPGRATRVSAAGRWGMEGLFDVQVFSYQVGALKPDARMYQAILAALAVPAAQALFIDDAPANVAGALAVGMEAVQFVGTEPLMHELRKRGLPVNVAANTSQDAQD